MIICVYSVRHKLIRVSKTDINETQINLYVLYETKKIQVKND